VGDGGEWTTILGESEQTLMGRSARLRARSCVARGGPRADKREIQHSANYRACEGMKAAHPFFGGFLAEFYGKTFGNARG